MYSPKPVEDDALSTSGAKRGEAGDSTILLVQERTWRQHQSPRELSAGLLQVEQEQWSVRQGSQQQLVAW